MRATQRRHEQPLDPLGSEPVRDRPRLLQTVLGKVRVSAPVHEREPRARKSDLRGPVPDDDDLGSPLRQAERPLLVGAGVDRCGGTAQGFTSTLIVTAGIGLVWVLEPRLGLVTALLTMAMVAARLHSVPTVVTRRFPDSPLGFPSPSRRLRV